MQKLHLVGFTTDHKSLILSARRGARSGGFVLAVDDALAEAVASAMEQADGAAPGGDDELELVELPPPRPQSALSVRELQARLRSGRSIESVAAEAGVDPEWVTRFAAPVLAEQLRVIEETRNATFSRARLGPSALRLGPSVYRNLAAKGVDAPVDELDKGWTARQVSDGRWSVTFRYVSRGRKQKASWELEVRTGEVRALDRLGGELAFVPGAPKPASPAAAPTKPAKVPGSSAPSDHDRANARRVSEARKAAEAQLVDAVRRETKRSVEVTRRAASPKAAAERARRAAAAPPPDPASPPPDPASPPPDPEEPLLVTAEELGAEPAPGAVPPAEAAWVAAASGDAPRAGGAADEVVDRIATDDAASGWADGGDDAALAWIDAGGAGVDDAGGAPDDDAARAWAGAEAVGPHDAAGSRSTGARADLEAGAGAPGADDVPVPGPGSVGAATARPRAAAAAGLDPAAPLAPRGDATEAVAAPLDPAASAVAMVREAAEALIADFASGRLTDDLADDLADHRSVPTRDDTAADPWPEDAEDVPATRAVPSRRRRPPAVGADAPGAAEPPAAGGTPTATGEVPAARPARGSRSLTAVAGPAVEVADEGRRARRRRSEDKVVRTPIDLDDLPAAPAPAAERRGPVFRGDLAVAAGGNGAAPPPTRRGAPEVPDAPEPTAPVPAAAAPAAPRRRRAQPLRAR